MFDGRAARNSCTLVISEVGSGLRPLKNIALQVTGQSPYVFSSSSGNCALATKPSFADWIDGAHQPEASTSYPLSSY
jgi:hypothetical protein